MDEIFRNRRITEALSNSPGAFNILEEQIDVKLQMEYFRFARRLRKRGVAPQLAEKEDLLFDPETSLPLKRRILVALATHPRVEAFRTIEKYLANPDEGMKEWATLAFQESRMLLQSFLLDEQQIFISTGLGGKGQKLRYFVVFFNSKGTSLSPMQSKLLHDELIYELRQTDGELEEFTEMIDYTTAMVILPINAPLKEIFGRVINECNQYGDFLQDDLVITNVKRLTPPEIVEILNKNRQEADSGEDDREE